MGTSVAGVVAALLLAFALVVWVPEQTRRRQAVLQAAEQFKRQEAAKVVAEISEAGGLGARERFEVRSDAIKPALLTATAPGLRALTASSPSSEASSVSVSGAASSAPVASANGSQTSSASPAGPRVIHRTMAQVAAADATPAAVAPVAPVVNLERKRAAVLQARASGARRRKFISVLLLSFTISGWGLFSSALLAWYFALIPSVLFVSVLGAGFMAARSARLADKRYYQARRAALATTERVVAAQTAKRRALELAEAAVPANKTPLLAATNRNRHSAKAVNPAQSADGPIKSATPSRHPARSERLGETEALAESQDLLSLNNESAQPDDALGSLNASADFPGEPSVDLAAPAEPETHWALGTQIPWLASETPAPVKPNPARKSVLAAPQPEVELPVAEAPEAVAADPQVEPESAAPAETAKKRTAPTPRPKPTPAEIAEAKRYFQAWTLAPTPADDLAAQKASLTLVEPESGPANDDENATQQSDAEAAATDSGPNAIVLAFPAPPEQPAVDTLGVPLDEILARRRAVS